MVFLLIRLKTESHLLGHCQYFPRLFCRKDFRDGRVGTEDDECFSVVGLLKYLPDVIYIGVCLDTNTPQLKDMSVGIDKTGT